jgi:hypothetical protein
MIKKMSEQGAQGEDRLPKGSREVPLMILVHCPHCQQWIEILAINCAIFRCGIYRQTGEQLPPHLSKAECDRVAEQQLIFGCGKPFRVQPASPHPPCSPHPPSEPAYEAVVCDYI